jgi:hypothetical protein
MRVLLTIVAALVVVACTQPGASNQLEGTSWRDENSRLPFVLRIQPDGVAEIDINNGENVGRCTWETTVEAVQDQTGPLLTFECPRPMNTGAFRFDVAFSPDLTTGQRALQIDDIRQQMFAVSGEFDTGRHITRFEE